MNVVSLGDWLALARTAGVPAVPGERIADVAIADILQFDVADFEGPDRVARWQRLADLTHAAHAGGCMVRWDCCAPLDMKIDMADGNVLEARTRFCGPDDPRLWEILDDVTADPLPVWRRPWIEAAMIEGFPVEFRAFVRAGRVVGISNYYPQRSLPDTPEIEALVAEARALAERMVARMVLPLEPQAVLSRHGINHAEASCTLDFLSPADGRGLLFLEGGPPFTGHWGAHPCCFEGREIAGVALGLAPEPVTP